MFESKSLEVLQPLELFYLGCVFLVKSGDCENVELELLGGQTQAPIVAEVPIVELLDKRPDENVVFGVGPRVGEGEVVLSLVGESVLKSELKPFLTLGDAVLLQGESDPGPILVVFLFENGQVALSEQFDLVAHVHQAERGSASLGHAFHGEVEPRAVR